MNLKRQKRRLEAMIKRSSNPNDSYELLVELQRVKAKIEYIEYQMKHSSSEHEFDAGNPNYDKKN